MQEVKLLVEKEGAAMIGEGKRLFVEGYEKACRGREPVCAWETWRVKMLSLQEVAVTVDSINGNDAFGSTRVIGLPLELFILLVVVVDIIIAGLIIVVAMKKLQPTSREEEVKEAMQGIELTEIKGIGPKKAEELRAVGVNTVLDLAKSSAKDLSQKIGISEKTISRWIVQANRTHEHMEALSELRRQNGSS